MKLRDAIRRLPILAICATMTGSPVSAQTPEPVDVVFRKQVTAVLGVNGADGILLKEADGAPPRRLKVGEVWRDGWSLAVLTSNTATLLKGAEEKVVDLAAYPDEAAKAAPALANIVLTNARPEGSPRATREQLQALVQSGDAQAVFAGGGGAGQVLTAMRNAAGTGGDERTREVLTRFTEGASRDQITFGSVDGRDALIRLGPDGQPAIVVSTDLTQVISSSPEPPRGR